MSWKNRNGFKEKDKKVFNAPTEEDFKFDEFKKKYANAVGFLLVKNIGQSELRAYFEASEDTQRKLELIKKFRGSMAELRPKSKPWIDKGFYLGIKLGEPGFTDDGTQWTQVIIGGCIFKQKTSVIGSPRELDSYIETIASIINSEKVWSDPDMADFDTGEREDRGDRILKKKKKVDAATGGDDMQAPTGTPNQEMESNEENPSSQTKFDTSAVARILTRSRQMNSGSAEL